MAAATKGGHESISEIAVYISLLVAHTILTPQTHTHPRGHRHPLSPRDREQRVSHGLCGRASAQTVAPAPRRRARLTWYARWGRRPLAATAVLCLVLAWPAVRVWQARSQVTDLCAGAVAGAPAAEQEANARASGLNIMSWQDPKPGRPAIIAASGGVFFFRWVCVVEHADGKVVATRTFILD